MKIYEMSVAQAAPTIPNCGINKIFKNTFKIIEATARYELIKGFPLPDKSLVMILLPLKATAPINRICKGITASKYISE